MAVIKISRCEKMMDHFRKLFLVEILFVVMMENGRTEGWIYDDAGCRIPENGVGTCVEFEECATIETFLGQFPRPIPEEILDELDKFVCGGTNKKAKICCPSRVEDIKINKPPNRIGDGDNKVPKKTHYWHVPEEEDDTCRTPDRQTGVCKFAKDCKPFTTFLQNTPRPISQFVRQQLQAYSCGENSKICCPSGPIVINDPTSVSATPPDISNHRNFGLLPEDCGYLDIGSKIVYGVSADINEFPWMAVLFYNKRNRPNFECGATIINERYILTAAHCIKGQRHPLLFVRVGEYDMSTTLDCQKKPGGTSKCTGPVQDVAIEEIISHPGWDQTTSSHDIGLLRVSKMNLSVENVRPVCLPTNAATRDATFLNGIITGWGKINNLGPKAQVLQKVSLPIVNLDECRKIYAKHNIKVTSRQLCAGSREGKDSCNGDSGGPLHVATWINDDTRYVQQGIVSLGPKQCGRPDYPGIYTRVAYYMDWILDSMRP